VRKALATDGDGQLVQVSEVGLAEPPRYMLLCEEHLAAGTFHGSPSFDVPL
jgi:hypothetical protein